MLRIPLPFPDTVLMLWWRWSEMSLAMKVVLPFLCIAPFALVIWLYLYEMRLVPPVRAALLLGLPIVSLLLVFFLVLFEPVVRHITKFEERGRVVIAVDRSASMDVADPQRPPVEKLRLARALHLVTHLCSDEQLDGWIKQYEKNKGGQLVWVGDNEFADPAEKKAAAEKRRQQHNAVCVIVDGLTRTQTAERILGEKGVALLPGIHAKHNVDLMGFAQKSWEVKPDQLDALFDARPVPAQGTDLGLPLARARELVGTGDDKPLAVILLTDGQHNWDQPLGDGQDPHERPPTAKADRLGERGVPIYPVALGAREAPPTLAVVRIKTLPTVRKGVDAGVDADVLVTGLPKQKIRVELARAGQMPLVEIIEHQGKDRSYPVHFQVRFDKVGRQVMTITAKADPNVPPPVGKLRTELSERSTPVNVTDDRVRVLLVDREARYDFHYLNMDLRRDRTMQVSSVLFEQPRLGRVPEEDLKKMNNPALTLPAEADALPNFACIVPGDVSPDDRPLPDRVRLEKYVADAGHTLIIVAGKRPMPLAYTDPKDPLVRLLPIINPRPFESNLGATLRVTEDGDQEGFLRMEDGTPEKSRERWTQLPPHYWGMIGEAKPGATVLATFDDGQPPRPVDKKDKEDPARKKALIVRQNYGFGRVVYVGLDSTFRWRKYEADKYHHRFWSQLVHWAASDTAILTGNDSLRFGTRSPVYEEGDEVDVVVRLAEDVPPLAEKSVAGARMFRVNKDGSVSEDAVALLMLNRHPAQPRVLEGKVRDLPEGNYVVELVIPELGDRLMASTATGQPGPMRAPFTMTRRDNTEMIDLTTNWDLLTELALRSNGKVYTPEDVGQLVEELKKKTITREVPTENKLLHAWWLLGLFLGLVTIEWIGRKTAGLP